MFNTFIPLAGTISGGGWAADFFTAIRVKCIAHAGVISSLAISLACVFIAFKLIRMYYDLVSDEQAGGFAGIRMWDILRPIVLLLLTMTVGTWLPWLDSICNTVSSSLVANMNNTTNEIDAKTAARLDELQDEINKNDAQVYEDAVAAAASASGINSDKELQNLIKNQEDRTRENTQNLLSGDSIQSLLPSDAHSPYIGANGNVKYKTGLGVYERTHEITLDELAKMKNGDIANRELIEAQQNQINTYKSTRDDYVKQHKEMKKWSRWLNSGSSIIGTVFNWFFNLSFVVMMAFADIMLCMLAMFGPLALAMSILEPWKQSFTSWIGHYVEVSLWKPVGAAICWIIMTMKSAVGSLGLAAATGVTATAGKATILGAIGAECLILFAGWMAMFQVPSITNTILSLGNMSDQFTNSAADATSRAVTAPIRGAKSIISPGGRTGGGGSLGGGGGAPRTGGSGAFTSSSPGGLETGYGYIDF